MLNILKGLKDQFFGVSKEKQNDKLHTKIQLLREGASTGNIPEGLKEDVGALIADRVEKRFQGFSDVEAVKGCAHSLIAEIARETGEKFTRVSAVDFIKLIEECFEEHRVATNLESDASELVHE